MRNKGFTLVELMVVVAIIIILAAILVPRYLDVTKTSKVARCHANQKTLDAASAMFMADDANVDHDPPAGPADLVGLFIEQVPTCPNAGTYSFDIYGVSTCDVDPRTF